MIPVQNSNGNFCTINSHEHSSEIDAFFNCNNKRERQKCILVRQFSFEINDDDQKKKFESIEKQNYNNNFIDSSHVFILLLLFVEQIALEIYF